MNDARSKIRDTIGEARQALAGMEGPAVEAIGSIAEAAIAVLKAGCTILVCGNGGSAADAQHIAAELVGRFRRKRPGLACVALTTDGSILTSVSNDLQFEQVFARQVEALGRSGDLLWAISTSGNSPDVLAAAKAARARGMKVVGMTGSAGGELAKLSDVCFQAPADRTDLVQLLHQVAYHAVCELVDQEFARGPE